MATALSSCNTAKISRFSPSKLVLLERPPGITIHAGLTKESLRDSISNPENGLDIEYLNAAITKGEVAILDSYYIPAQPYFSEQIKRTVAEFTFSYLIDGTRLPAGFYDFRILSRVTNHLNRSQHLVGDFSSVITQPPDTLHYVENRVPTLDSPDHENLIFLIIQTHR